MSDPALPYHVLKSELEKQLERNRMLLIQQAHEEEVRAELKSQLVAATQAYDCAMAIHGTVMQERDQLKAELEQFHEVNFRQAQKINDINGARNAFYNELAQALGIDPQNEENPSIVGEIKKIKAELETAKKINDIWGTSESESVQKYADALKERDKLKAEVQLLKSQLVKSNRDCLDARAEARDATASDNAMNLLEILTAVVKERDTWREMAAVAIDRLKAAMGHISGEHPHWRNGAATLARFNAMEKGEV